MERVVTFLSLLLVLIVAADIAGQSRRGSAQPKGEKPNARPTPTPPPATPQSDPAADDADDGEVITVDTRLVTIPVRVIDRKNRFVTGLAKENFKVFEDGVEQEIAHFSNEQQPFTVALVLDMSYSTTFKISEIQSAAIAFIDQLRPHDKVMVVSFDQEVHLLCEPTNDRKAIYKAISSTKISTGTSLYEAVNMVINDRFKTIEGRKAIILFTDGVDTTSQEAHLTGNLRDAMEIDALIYPIRYDTFSDVQAMKNKPVTSQPGSLPRTPPTVPTKDPSSPFPIPIEMIGMPSSKGTTPDEYAAAEEYLNQLALRTGGQVYVASTFGNLSGAFTKIASELREFYSLGYYPKDDEISGKTRRLKVRVDRESVAVRARDSYAVRKNNP